MSQVSLKPGRYNTTYVSASSSALYPNVSQTNVGVRGKYATSQGAGGYVGLIPQGHQPKSGHYGRRRERVSVNIFWQIDSSLIELFKFKFDLVLVIS